MGHPIEGLEAFTGGGEELDLGREAGLAASGSDGQEGGQGGMSEEARPHSAQRYQLALGAARA
ncbi:hypothetical protein DB31_8610 [Hyalangium minutum]|uniref:Uncharacterized protein n=1 Tax=Hyalangium minutum TaxID=394096 RepID=A0A085WHU4_9BACT|nr:hypothetical protein DB31_8610 [Hyalangium minutum]